MGSERAAVPVNQILVGDALDHLRRLPSNSVNCVVTSPPYWGLRDYGVAGQIGLEPTIGEFIARLVEVFREVRRVLREDGTAWVNMGDCYTDSGRGADVGSTLEGTRRNQAESRRVKVREIAGTGLRPKNLVGQPWRLAFALQADGWFLREDIIWAKPNPMPESVADRPTRAHEYVFLLSKSARYFYDAAAVKTPAKHPGGPHAPEKISSPFGQGFTRRADKQRGHGKRHAGFNERWDRMTRDDQQRLGANLRSVWWIATSKFREAHFATFPEKLVEPCILAGCPKDGIVLDPFMGSGTTALVALKAGRRFVGIELNHEYAALARRRIEPELTQGRLA